jgi:dihydrofolate synthase/folylpolyglutamate synthase
MQNELLSWLLTHYGQEQMRPGIERIRKSLEDILPTLSQSKIITIAGTNGKGETTLRLSEKLSGRSHCVWTSPHIERITERFRSEEGEIQIDLLKEIITECHEDVQTHHYELSFYEFLFLVFCRWALRRNPEFILLEVGLGGRLDAVNVFNADLVLLPSISRDHQEILGKRYDQILLEKLGTLREKTTLIHFLESQYLKEKTLEYAKSMGATVVSLDEKVSIPNFEFSFRNEALASAAFSFLMKTPFSLERPKHFLEHRGEVFTKDGEWIFYGSHNVDGLRKLIQFLHSGTYTFSRPPYDVIIVAFSRRNLEDVRVMLRMLKQAALGKIVVTVFSHPKALDAQTMEVLSREEGSEFVQDIETFIQRHSSNQRVLVTGSYYFLGEFKALLRGQSGTTHSR